MTRRERYLKALRNEAVDSMVWAPNFGYWATFHKKNGTLPERFSGMSYFDMIRSVGGYIWTGASAFKRKLDPSVRVVWEKMPDGSIVSGYDTPIGSLRSLRQPTESEHSSEHLSEHEVKSAEDLRVKQYVVEATSYEADYSKVRQTLLDVGEDGVVWSSGGFVVPFIMFARTDVGYNNAYFLMHDHKKECDALLNAYFLKYMELCKILADSPADIVVSGDNMDGVTMPPPLFREYAVPFYQEAAKIVKGAGKLFEGHWCGRTKDLLPLVPGCGLDVVEAIVTRPMDDISLARAIELLKGEVVLQGGIPSVLVCEEGGTRDDFENYIRDTILPLRGRRGFILGMSDNVPPNADFKRIEMIADLLSDSIGNET